uniref:CCHC-type domain-containing protein n=1 Tax=Parascaris univalens TaxID=6257 RepID=A0A915AA01_PARUN
MSMNAVQLPRLQIAKFDGQHHKWPQFWATFLHVVDSQPLAEIEKLSYLLSFLEGKALEAVGGFTIAPENYEAVKTTLQQRFGRSELLLKSLYAELHDAASPTKDFEECVASVERILQQLEQQGENIDNSQTELCIEKRLPRWALLEVEQAKEADAAWSVRKLRDKLQAIVRIRENMRTAAIGKPTHEGRQAQRQVGRQEQRNLGGVKLEEGLHHTSALPAVAKRQTKGKDRRRDLTRQVLRAIKRMLRSTQICLGRTLWETVQLEGPATAGELDWAECILIRQEQTKISEEFERVLH